MAIKIKGTTVIDDSRNFIGDGSSITSLTAGNLTGTIPSTVLGNSTVYIGTTSVALNRASAGLSLTGVSIDGSSASCSGNANTATTWQTARTLTVGGTGKSVNGGANVSWSLTEIGVPSTTGTGASGTWGISITGNADTVDGLHVHSGINNEINKIVRTDSNGYLQTGYIHSTSGNEGNNSNPARVWGTNGTDSYLRTYLTSALSVNYAASAGSAPANGGTSSYVTINYNNNSNGTYSMLWGSGNGVYGTAEIYCNPSNGYLYADSFYCGNWFRSSGNTGWYNATYAGGITMEDTTWVKVYGSKAFYVANQIAATGNVTAYYSDERLKNKTGNVDNAIDKICSLNAFYYTNNELAQSFGYNDTKQQIGLSAQEVQKVLPEVVSLAPFDMQTDEFSGEISSKSGKNYLTLDYAKLVPLLVEAIKEQQNQINQLKNLINK